VDQLGELRDAIALELRGRGLAPKSAQDYSATLMRAERFCRERGTTVRAATPELLGRFAFTLTLDKRAQAASALRHYFDVLGRSDPKVPALRVAGRQPGRSRSRTEGHRRGTPHSGHAWERTDNAGAARVRDTRERMLRDGMSDKTISHYSSMLWRAECWAEMRGLSLVELDARTLAEYSETLSGSSRRSFRSALRAYYAALDADDAPIGAVRPPRKPPLLPKPLELEEAQKLLAVAVAEGGRRGVAVMLGLLLGLRRFEIAKLRFADFSNGWVRFVGKCQRDASLPIPELVMRAVDGLPHDSPFLFPGQSGAHVTPATVWLWVRSVTREAGIGDVAAHRLRHTCLTVANDETGDLRAVQTFARHADPETTAGYTRVTQERLLSIGQAVLGALSGPETPPAEPLVPLSFLALACEGPHAVEPWLELARLFFDRPGWRLSATDDGAGIVSYEFGDDLSASVLCWTNDRPPTYVLTRVLASGTEDMASWDFADTGSMGAVLGEFETGEQIPFTPTVSILGGKLFRGEAREAGV
jgi:site-specific recombinase XerD